MTGGRAWLGVLALAMGFAWPGQTERLVGELTRAATPRDKRDALRLLGTLDSYPEAAVLPFTRDPDPGVRLEAYRLLGKPPFDPAPEVRILHASLDDPEPRVRLAAVRAGADTKALIARLDDEALEVRIEAAHALAGRPDATFALWAHAEASLPELRAAVIDALAYGEMTADVEHLLRRALDDHDLDVVLAALRGYARHPELVPPKELRTLANGVHPQLAHAARALIAPRRTWDDPPWLAALERTVDSDPIEALEAWLPERELRATEPLRVWLARAPPALVPRIVALIERTRGVDEDAERTLALARDPQQLQRLASHYARAALPVLAAADALPHHLRLERTLRGELRADAETAALALRALGAMRVSVLSALDDASPGIVIAALRGSVHDRSPSARKKRAALQHAALPQIAASALTASVLAGDRLDERWLRAQSHAAWPIAVVAAWALRAHSAASEDAGPVPSDRFVRTQRHTEPRTLRTASGLTTVSWPDASGRVDWPALATVDDSSAWPPDGERK